MKFCTLQKKVRSNAELYVNSFKTIENMPVKKFSKMLKFEWIIETSE